MLKVFLGPYSRSEPTYLIDTELQLQASLPEDLCHGPFT